MRKEFHNYVLSKEELPYHGVVIPGELFKIEELSEPLMKWTIPPFGWNFSPYFTLRMLAQDLELLLESTLAPIINFIGTMFNLIYHVQLDMIPSSLVFGLLVLMDMEL